VWTGQDGQSVKSARRRQQGAPRIDDDDDEGDGVEDASENASEAGEEQSPRLAMPVKQECQDDEHMIKGFPV
jgi:hypothetical protein